MYKNIVKLIIALLIIPIAYACEEVKGKPQVFEEKDKTVLIYMVGNNNLAYDASINLEQLQKGYIPGDEGNIIAYYHVTDSNPMLLHIKQGENGTPEIDTAYRFPAINSATAPALKSAMQVTATLFPAKEYGLILWSHGTGWLPDGYYANNPSASHLNIDRYASMIKMDRGAEKRVASGDKTRSFGLEEGKEMNITDLTQALAYKLSFILFDACLMGGIEVAYELKDSTDYVMACPTEILTDGYPYDKIMQHIFKPATDLTSVAEEVYNYYSSNPNKNYVTISLIKTSELKEVAECAKPIFAANREKIEALNTAQIQPYFRMNKHWFYDLGDFISHLASEEAVAPFKAALEKAVIYKAATPRFIELPIDKNRFSGLSTYIPNPANEELDNFYLQFAWNKDTEMILQPAEEVE